MLFCGIKVTHDSAVAVIDGNELLFSVEMEKIANSARYSTLPDVQSIEAVLAAENIPLSKLPSLAVDGWSSEEGAVDATAWMPIGGVATKLPVAPYVGGLKEVQPLRKYSFSGVPGTPFSAGYTSYSHVAGHLLSSYCSSPFSESDHDALILCWDGGMVPLLYRIRPDQLSVEALGPLMPVVGNIFSTFCMAFEPFNTQSELEVSGKAMAFAALGEVNPQTFSVFDTIIEDGSIRSATTTHLFGQEIAKRRDELFPGLTNADLIANFQAYLGDRLVKSFRAFLRRAPQHRVPNLCLAGGCALNIKWNSLLRESSLFQSIWIPPFTNDSGGAIGAACCEMVHHRRHFHLKWNVYSGPQIREGAIPAGWEKKACSEAELGMLLHREGEAVVVLHGRAELGPRALGNRSIIAPAVDIGIKDRLNAMKGREAYRPVAPICLVDRSSEVFVPGERDPYMLFDHRLRSGWRDRVPGVMHLDGSARLQTVDRRESKTPMSGVLEAYEQASGIPLLCNTSANLPGCGFFPDVETAAKWGKSKFIWSNGTLYINPNPPAQI